MEFYHNLWLLLWLYSLQNSSMQLFKLIQTKLAKSAAGKLYPSWSPAQKWGGGKEHQTLSKSCLPGLWVSVLLPLRLLWCWAVLQGDATEWLPWQMAMNWQLKRALCREKKKDTKKCALTNRWNQCHWNREWILQAESLCRETAWGLFLGYTLCLSCGGFSRWDERKRYTSPSEWMFKMLAGKICCICMSNVLSQVDALFIFFLNFSRFGCSFCTLKDGACHLCKVLRK